MLIGKVEMGVAAADDQREDRQCEGVLLALAHLQQNRVDVAFEVIDGDERLAEGEGQGFGVGDADEQSAGEAGAFSDGNGVQVGELDAGAGDGFADDGDNVAQVLARGEFGDDAAVDRMHRHLRGDDVGERLRARAHDGGRGFVARAFDAEYQAGVHVSIVEDAMNIDANAKFEAAAGIVLRLREAGYEAYFAGGCVRDLLLGIVPKDYDVATSATPEQVVGLFRKTFTVGAHFGVVLVVEGDVATEVATFRSDGAYSDGRRPDAVRFSTDVRTDVLRRDFTINGMLLDPAKFGESQDAAGAVLDYVHGREDLAEGVIRALGGANLRFEEDKLRMLRAVRFAARFGFTIEPITWDAICAHAKEIHAVSHERVRDELTRMLTEGAARRAFELLDATGLLREVLPEVVKMQGVAQPPQFHPEGDVWTHTLMLLEQLPAGCAATLAWGALLHDVGKPATFTAPTGPEDRIRFNGHVEVGVRVAEAICGRLRFSNEETAQISALVKNHMRFGDVREMKASTLKRFLRLENFPEHLALHRMDCMAAHGDLTLYEYAKAACEATPAEEVRPALLVTGRELIAAGYKPGARFKEMLAFAEDAQLEGRVRTREEAMELVRGSFGLPSDF
jgi:poly(A) polymerase